MPRMGKWLSQCYLSYVAQLGVLVETVFRNKQIRVRKLRQGESVCNNNEAIM